MPDRQSAEKPSSTISLVLVRLHPAKRVDEFLAVTVVLVIDEVFEPSCASAGRQPHLRANARSRGSAALQAVDLRLRRRGASRLDRPPLTMIANRAPAGAAARLVWSAMVPTRSMVGK